jgi:hypothetical protein
MIAIALTPSRLFITAASAIATTSMALINTRLADHSRASQAT